MTTVIVSGARTPIGRMLGTLQTETADLLGGHAIRAAVHRSGIDPSEFDGVLLGNAVQAGVGANPARLAAIAGGIPLDVPAITVNKLCLSGLTAIAQSHLAIAAGQWTAAVAGGTESMSNAPYLLRGARKGFRYGDAPAEDSLNRDALLCAIDQISMGAATERYQRELALDRYALDEFAAGSHQKAIAAQEAGRFDDEVVAVAISAGQGTRMVERDEGIRADISAASLSGLRPAFAPDGTLTAASSSQLSDGAAALILMDKKVAQARGFQYLAEIVSYGSVAGPDPSLLHQPARALSDALRRARLEVKDLDVVEFNEAFASVALASIADLQLDPARVNPNGGAIAIGHPLGMSGARLVLTLCYELRRRGGGIGAAALCGGGGQGDALIVRVPD